VWKRGGEETIAEIKRGGLWSSEEGVAKMSLFRRAEGRAWPRGVGKIGTTRVRRRKDLQRGS